MEHSGVPLARRLDESFVLIRDEVEAYFAHEDASRAFRGVGSHTTQFDKLIAGNGTWVDVRLWRGRFLFSGPSLRACGREPGSCTQCNACDS